MPSDAAQDFPCTLYAQEPESETVGLTVACRTIDIPFPTHRLASSAMRAVQVDAEISPLVRRTISVVSAPEDTIQTPGEDKRIMRTMYSATTNRMLRVAVNGFMESIGVVLQVMEELDVDVLEQKT